MEQSCLDVGESDHAICSAYMVSSAAFYINDRTF